MIIPGDLTTEDIVLKIGRVINVNPDDNTVTIRLIERFNVGVDTINTVQNAFCFEDYGSPIVDVPISMTTDVSAYAGGNSNDNAWSMFLPNFCPDYDYTPILSYVLQKGTGDTKTYEIIGAFRDEKEHFNQIRYLDPFRMSMRLFPTWNLYLGINSSSYVYYWDIFADELAGAVPHGTNLYKQLLYFSRRLDDVDDYIKSVNGEAYTYTNDGNIPSCQLDGRVLVIDLPTHQRWEEPTDSNNFNDWTPTFSEDNWPNKMECEDLLYSDGSTAQSISRHRHYTVDTSGGTPIYSTTYGIVDAYSKTEAIDPNLITREEYLCRESSFENVGIYVFGRGAQEGNIIYVKSGPNKSAVVNSALSNFISSVSGTPTNLVLKPYGFMGNYFNQPNITDKV